MGREKENEARVKRWVLIARRGDKRKRSGGCLEGINKNKKMSDGREAGKKNDFSSAGRTMFDFVEK